MYLLISNYILLRYSNDFLFGHVCWMIPNIYSILNSYGKTSIIIIIYNSEIAMWNSASMWHFCEAVSHWLVKDHSFDWGVCILYSVLVVFVHTLEKNCYINNQFKWAQGLEGQFHLVIFFLIEKERERERKENPEGEGIGGRENQKR